MTNFWYHDTNEYFENWLQPPISSKYKPGFLPHSFISLTKDKQLAKITGNIAQWLMSMLTYRISKNSRFKAEKSSP